MEESAVVTAGQTTIALAREARTTTDPGGYEVVATAGSAGKRCGRIAPSALFPIHGMKHTL